MNSLCESSSSFTIISCTLFCVYVIIQIFNNWKTMLKYFDGTKISPNNTLTTKFYILHIFYALLPVK